MVSSDFCTGQPGLQFPVVRLMHGVDAGHHQQFEIRQLFVVGSPLGNRLGDQVGFVAISQPPGQRAIKAFAFQQAF